VFDATWLENHLFTLSGSYPSGSTVATGAVIRKCDEARQLTITQNLSSHPIRLLTAGGSLCAITVKDGRPRFTVLSPGLEILSTAPGSTPDPDPINPIPIPILI
jgi:hypothetical protein